MPLSTLYSTTCRLERRPLKITIVSSRTEGALMIWTAKEVNPADCARDFNQLEQKYLELGGPGNMMLVAENREDGTKLLLWGSPEVDQLALFLGFEPIADHKLPRKAQLLIRRATAFKDFFRYVE
jgi:hypothetical protein